MRQTRKKAPKRAVEKSADDLTEVRLRLSVIIQQMEALELRVSLLEEAQDLVFDPHPALDKPRRGPAQKIGDAELLERRDSYVLGLEQIGPASLPNCE